MRRLLLCSVIVGVACSACQKPAARLNAPPHGTCEEPSPLQEEFVQMVDNALLADMTVSDIHFVPQRAMLNSLGEERLTHLADLMERYGGTIRFSTDVTDKPLVEARTKSILTFLSTRGIDTLADTLVQDMPASTGMDAAQAILIKMNEATYHPKRSAGSSGGASTGDKPNGLSGNGSGTKQGK